jgi:hypothetical protein
MISSAPPRDCWRDGQIDVQEHDTALLNCDEVTLRGYVPGVLTWSGEWPVRLHYQPRSCSIVYIHAGSPGRMLAVRVFQN